MVFTSISFLFLFLPAALGFYFLTSLKGGRRLQNLFLLIISVLFYAWSGVGACILLIGSAIVNFCLGCQMYPDSKHRKLSFVLAIIFNVALLGFFKYFNFIVDNIEFVLQLMLPNYQIPAPYIPLPVGISFFTFQILSYQIDVFWGNVKPQKKLTDLLLYIMLFPQLIAGPIVRYIDVEDEIGNRRATFALFQDGIRRFMIGFSKKVLLADKMGYVSTHILSQSGQLPTPYAWAGMICYTLQLYLDFSAYSDMAIGLGNMFGFHFMENFNYPLISKSIKEFWNRWHLSLSTWFRDYIYIPMGGSREGTKKTYRNLLFVFFLTGLWHGASWSFVIWGMIQGMFICLERMGFDKILKKLPRILRHFYVLIIYVTSFVFFQNDNLTTDLNILHSLYSWNLDGIRNISVLSLFDCENLFFFVCSAIACTPAFRILAEEKGKRMEALGNIFIGLVFVLAICYRMSSGFNPFIYFRF